MNARASTRSWPRLLVIAAVAVSATSCTIADQGPASPPPPTVSLDRFQSEIDAFRQADALSPPAACQTLFVGSSSIRMWDDLATRFAFPIIRRGVGGSTIAEINHYFGDIVAPYRPSRIVLYAGENDLNDGRSPVDTLADLRQFMTLKRARLGATPVYFISAKPSPSRLADLPRQQQFNAIAQAYAGKEHDLAFIDVASAMMDGGAVRPDIFREDRLHMLSGGYDIWTRVIDAALAQPPESRAPGC